jgi:hypothetical protein
MVNQRRKIQREAAKKRAELRHAADRELDTIYWLVFEPRTDIPVPPNKESLWEDPWRIRLFVNPNGRPDVIEGAIVTFERNFNVKSWREIAVRHYVGELYWP